MFHGMYVLWHIRPSNDKGFTEEIKTRFTFNRLWIRSYYARYHRIFSVRCAIGVDSIRNTQAPNVLWPRSIVRWYNTCWIHLLIKSTLADNIALINYCSENQNVVGINTRRYQLKCCSVSNKKASLQTNASIRIEPANYTVYIHRRNTL